MLRIFSPFMRTFAAVAGLINLQSRAPMPIAGHSYSGRRGPARPPGKGMSGPPNDTGWWQRHASIRPMVITERMLMRHGWYRRKLRQQGIAIDSNAKNAVRL